MVFCQKQAQNILFNTSSERPLSNLSENRKINVIGQMVMAIKICLIPSQGESHK